MFNYNNLRQQYDGNTLQKVRNHENLARKHGRYTSHLRFNLQCKHSNIIPKSIKIKAQTNSNEARNILHRAEKALLNLRISETIKKRNNIKNEKSKIESELNNTLPKQIMDQIIENNAKREHRELEKYTRTQRNKYYNLRYGHNYNDTPNPQPILDENNNIPAQNVNKPPDEPKWVHNISDYTLTQSETSILSKGAGFALSPENIPYNDFIAATELACKSLPKAQSAALRGEVTEIMRNEPKPKNNITQNERKALNNLKKNKNITILPADKGKSLVVMNTNDYIEKMEEKLADTNTYKRIQNDPTNEIKTQLISQLEKMKNENTIDQNLFDSLVPQTTMIPRIWGAPKVHKEGYPLREIVDSVNSITKPADKYISKIIKTYRGNTQHHINNSTDFINKIKDIKVEADETIVSYDVVALYPSIPQDEAIHLVHNKMLNDTQLHQKTPMSPDEAVQLFKTCVQTTYFSFNGKLYQQTNGLAIGASTSGFCADIFMEDLEQRALSTFT